MTLKARKGMTYPAVIEDESHHEVAYMQKHPMGDEAILQLAHLWTTAPELLRECKFALEMILSRAQIDAHFAADPGYRNFKWRLEQVIAKATGLDKKSEAS
jgi:hypothetical protein